MQSNPSLPSLPGPLWPGMVAPDKGPFYGLNRTKPCFLEFTGRGLNCVFMLNNCLKLNCILRLNSK